MENNPQNEPAQTNERPFEELANILGDRNMIKGEKETFLEKISDKIFINYDFVSPETYKETFDQLDIHGGNIALVGAGYPFAREGYSNLTKGLGKAKMEAQLIPVDIISERAKSWLLIDENVEKVSDGAMSISPVTADATKLPFADNSLSGYISTNLINEPKIDVEERDFIKDMLGEAYRTLQPGGFIILSSFGYYKYTWRSGKVTYNDYIEDLIAPEEIEKILSSVGFKDIKELPLDHATILEAIKTNKSKHLLENQDEGKDTIQKVNIIDPCAYLAIK